MLRKSPEHRPTSAELLRHSHLQPYLFRCRSPSSVFLPVKPTNNTYESKRKLSSSRSIGGKDNGETEVTELKEMGPILSFDENSEKQSTSLPNNDKFALIELAGVLKPFGEDAVSSRETGIWLTKSLMTA